MGVLRQTSFTESAYGVVDSPKTLFFNPQGGTMKFTRSAKFALATAASAALAFSLLTPAQAATRSTVILHQTNVQTGLNCNLTTTNSTVCTEQASLTGMGFNYYNEKKELIKNTTFGSYKIVKNSKTDFRVQYTVAPGRVWSDGTPITGVDLLLSHVLGSDAYSIAAGLGDPEGKDAPAFNGLGYSSTYNDNIAGEPVLSSDKMSVTLRWKGPIANWDIYGPGPSPVHALVLMAEGKDSLQSASANLAAKERFLEAFKDKDTALLKKMGKVWSEDYTITTINKDTNPLLLISNGGFIVESAVPKTSMTFKLNPKYNSGPKMSGSVDTVVFKVILDGTAATQALANGEIDLYAGQATADAVASLKKINSINVVGADQAVYEHFDLHFGTVEDEAEYTGLFSAKGGAKALALRKAFLLGIPREEIMEKLIAPINGKTTPLCTTWVAEGSPNYDKICAVNGSKFYTRGSQESRNKTAAALIKKFYPNAMKSPVKVNVLVPANNPRRASEFALTKANMAKIGFDLVGDVQSGWGGLLGNSKYDAYFFAWVSSSVLQRQSCGLFETGGPNNYVMGYKNTTLDAVCNSMYLPLKENILIQKYIQADRQIFADAVTLPMFTHPGIFAINKDLKGVKPNPLSPQLTWNFWEWSY
jgi:peptide/nickel transport system substrate-binding protein